MNRTGSDFPFREFEVLTHVGTVEEADRGSWSLEGEGLSVSLNPDAWVRIARLGERPWWSVSRSDGCPVRMVDAHALTDDLREEVTRWGVAEGLVVPVTCWAVTYYDSEWEEEMVSFYPTVGEAMEDRGPGVDVDEVTRLALSQMTSRGSDLGNVEDLLLTFWADAVGSFDGVWWEDVLDEGRMSAPRGVIPPGCLPRMRLVRVS